VAVIPTTWNPSDKTAMTLSNSDRTATGTGAGGVRSIFSTATGKIYWEVTYNGGTGPGIGIANASATLATVYNTPTNAAVSYNTTTWINNVSQAGAGIPISVAIPQCVAVDLGGKLIWFRSGAAGNWNNSGTANPATGTGGLNITVLGTPLFALAGTSSSAQLIANFGATAFTGAVPSGFTAGLGPDVVGTTSVRIMVLA